MDLASQLKRDEGLRLTPYKDSVGKWTIGYGRNLDDVGINREEAEFLLASDIAKVRLELTKALPWITDLDEPRRSVLLNMAFNLGIRGLLKFKRTLELVRFGDYDKAAVEMLKSVWATQVGERAQRLAKQMTLGVWQ